MFLLDYISYFVEYILRDPLTQGTGFGAMIVIIVAMFQKDDFTAKKLMLAATFFWGAHFILLGVYSGLAATIIFVIRYFCSLKWQKNKNVFLVIVGLTIGVGFFTYEGFYSILPLLASINGSFAFFYLEKIRLRLSMMLGSMMWLYYFTVIGSVGGMVNEVLVQTVLLSTIYRIIHPVGGAQYYAQKVKDILWKRSRPDYDRYIFIHDRLSKYRSILGEGFKKIIHYDLRNLLSKKKYQFLHKINRNNG